MREGANRGSQAPPTRHGGLDPLGTVLPGALDALPRNQGQGPGIRIS